MLINMNLIHVNVDLDHHHHLRQLCWPITYRSPASLNFLFTYALRSGEVETQAVQLSCWTLAQVFNLTLLIECQTNTGIERSCTMHKPVMGKGSGKSTAPGIDDRGWVCSSGTYLSMFI